MDALIYSLLFATIALALALMARVADRRILVAGCVAFALYLGTDDFVTGAPNAFKSLDFIGGYWNWTGKVFSLLLAALVMVLFKINRRAVALVMPYKNNTSSLVVTVVLILLSTVLGIVFASSPPNAETIAFQATMPGFAEELAYRGIAPALLLGLIGNRSPDTRIPWHVIIATGFMFSLWHGLGYKAGEFSFDLIPAAFTLLGGIAYGWLRFNSGSLLYPVLAHCAGNLVFQLMPLIDMSLVRN